MINQYFKPAEFTPLTLPYELIMKAGQASQERWDQSQGDLAKAEAAFANVIPIPGSEDDTVLLPEIKKKWANIQNEITSNPDIDPSQITYKVRKFAAETQPIINKINEAKSHYDKGQELRTQQEVTNKGMFPNELQPNYSLWNSSKMNNYSALNPISHEGSRPVTDTYFNNMQDSLLDVNYNADGTISEYKGINTEAVAKAAMTNASSYITNPNFQRENTLLSNKGYVSPLYNKPYDELSAGERAATIIYRDGLEKVNTDLDMMRNAQRQTKLSDGTKTPEYGRVAEPAMDLHLNTNQSATQIGSIIGVKPEADNSFIVTPAETGNISKFASVADNSNLPEFQKRVLVDRIDELSGSLKLGESLQRLKDLSDESAKYGMFYADKSKYRPQEVIQKEWKEQYDKIIQDFTKFNNTTEWADIKKTAMLDHGVDLSDRNAFESFVKDVINNKGTDKEKQKEALMSSLGEALPNMPQMKWTPKTGTNAINVGDNKYLLGYAMFEGNSEKEAWNTFYHNLPENIKSNLEDADTLGLPDFSGDDVNQVFKDIAKVSKVVVGDKETYRIQIPMNMKVNINDPSIVARYNRDNAGSDAILKENLPFWEETHNDVVNASNYNKFSERLSRPEVVSFLNKNINYYTDQAPKNVRSQIVSLKEQIVNDTKSNNQETKIFAGKRLMKLYDWLAASKEEGNFDEGQLQQIINEGKLVSQGQGSNPLGL